MSPFRLLALSLALAALSACERAGGESPAAEGGVPDDRVASTPPTVAPDGAEVPPIPIAGGAPNLEELARVVVEAIGRSDTAALEALRLTEREHNELVFPRLPAGKPPQNFPVDVAWTNIRTRNSVAVLRLLARYGGQSLTFRDVACPGGTQRFEGFRVATDCVVRFAGAGGEEHRELLFRHALSAGGRYKVFRYYDD
jgi:hypothetical protein